MAVKMVVMSVALKVASWVEKSVDMMVEKLAAMSELLEMVHQMAGK